MYYTTDELFMQRGVTSVNALGFNRTKKKLTKISQLSFFLETKRLKIIETKFCFKKLTV